VLNKTIENHPLVGTYGAGVIYPQNTLIIDSYGRLTINSSEGSFVGAVKIADDNTFSAELYGKKGTASVSGEFIENGLVKIRVTGALSYIDYYTTGSSYVIGRGTTILRIFNIKNNVVYILTQAETSANGEIAQIEVLSGASATTIGAILKITTAKTEVFVKVAEIGNVKTGFIFADGHRGVFTGEGEQLELDGFGRAVYGNAVGTYVVNGNNNVTVYINNLPSVYKLNVESGAYTKVDVAFDSSLVEGRAFSADLYFFCGEYMYLANTTFKFLAGGKVLVTSTSSEHDSGSEPCSVDKYAPVFCLAGGTQGTFNVSGTKVTVSVNGYTFVFNISNVMVVNELVCENNGGLTSEDHGYFTVGDKLIFVA
jgi:hypothetical protein